MIQETTFDAKNRVWVHQAAIDATRPKATPKFRQRRRISGVASSNKSVCSQTSTTSAVLNESENVTTASQHNGTATRQVWSWKLATLVETTANHVTVRLLSAEDDGNNLPEKQTLLAHSTDNTIALAPDVFQTGQVVLHNEYTGVDKRNDHSYTDIVPLPPDDLIALTHLHEPAVVESLQVRYAQNRIYTATGPVLLALNPFRNLRGLYGEAVMKSYWQSDDSGAPTTRDTSTSLPPHVYNIANQSFRNLMRCLEDGTNPHQSILVSGESGAGKTVSTKLVMKYLAALSHYRSMGSTRSMSVPRVYKRAREATQRHQRNHSNSVSSEFPERDNVLLSTIDKSSTRALPSMACEESTTLDAETNLGLDTIEAQVLQSNPILESFGNARTTRNDNSSRFGKFVELQFSARGNLVGAQLETYLLEKVRVVHVGTGERNYHIFYELLQAHIDNRRTGNTLGSYSKNYDMSQLHLAPTATSRDFKLTCDGERSRRDGVADGQNFAALLQAMQTLRFSEQEIREIWRVTSSLLHASNLNFVPVRDLTTGETDPDDACILDSTNVHLSSVCALLGVTEKELNQALCEVVLRAGKEEARKRMTAAQAQRALEALIKATYGALFEYLVSRINDAIQGENSNESNAGSAATIGVLDIFGFESFQVNSFEQLCINYCNEALQQQFNAFVLRNEQAEYEKEGILWKFIEFPENQDVLDLIDKRGIGILHILDDQCRAPGPSDTSFGLQVYQVCANSSRFSATRAQKAHLQFAVHHYAGPVTYTAKGFTEKNRDELPTSTRTLFLSSESTFVQQLAHILEWAPNSNASASAFSVRSFQRSDSTVGRPTVAGQFQRQLKKLRSKIDQTSPHYIRCLKPNDCLLPDKFDVAVVAEQLRCGGILEAVRVARAGFTQHYPHSDFYRRYRVLAWREMNKVGGRLRHSSSGNPLSAPSAIRPGRLFKVSNTDGTAITKNKDEASRRCKELLQILQVKIQHQQIEDGIEIAKPTDPKTSVQIHSTRKSIPSSCSQSIKSSHSSKPCLAPVRGHMTRQKLVEKKEFGKQKEITMSRSSRSAAWKYGGMQEDVCTNLGIQMGKSKVFLRHSAFEALERIRTCEQYKAATSLNATFRMYLARIAYVPYRNAFRQELQRRHHHIDLDDDISGTVETAYNALSSASPYRHALPPQKGGPWQNHSLVDKWTESGIRNAIHNPVPRSEWGKGAASTGNFKWVVKEGLWVKNIYALQESREPSTVMETTRDRANSTEEVRDQAGLIERC